MRAPVFYESTRIQLRPYRVLYVVGFLLTAATASLYGDAFILDFKTGAYWAALPGHLGCAVLPAMTASLALLRTKHKLNPGDAFFDWMVPLLVPAMLLATVGWALANPIRTVFLLLTLVGSGEPELLLELGTNVVVQLVALTSGTAIAEGMRRRGQNKPAGGRAW